MLNYTKDSIEMSVMVGRIRINISLAFSIPLFVSADDEGMTM